MHSSLESRSRHPCHDLVTRIDIFVCLAMPVQVSDTRTITRGHAIIHTSLHIGTLVEAQRRGVEGIAVTV